MILKKPFAFLIKHFKLIHMLLCIPMYYLLYRSSLILDFIKEYLDTNVDVVGSDLVSNLFDFKLVISIFIIFIGIIIVLSLMLYKRKPVTFYFYNIITYSFLSVIYMVSYSIIQTMQVSLVDVRTIKIIQDLIFTSIILQIFSAILCTIRATGFDIKKFDFRHDLDELDISAEDNEEFEIESQFDSDEFKRKIKKLKRHAKYVYVENRVVINLVFIALIGVIAYFIYNNSGIYSKNYKLSVAINTEKFIFNVKDNYQTSYDYKENKVTDKKLIVIKFSVKSNNGENKIDLTRFKLDTKNKTYKPINKYKTALSDLGLLYTGEKIGTEFNDFIMVFEIPSDEIEKMTLKYEDYNNKIVSIKLNPKDIDTETDNILYNSGDTLTFNDILFKDIKLTLKNFEINNTFKINYNFCLSENECYNSIEYLKPTYTENYRKDIIKLNGYLELSDDYDIELSDLLTTFGSISYNINGEDKNSYINIISPKHKTDGDIYIEVNSDIEQASNIKLNLKIRNKEYSYVIK